MVQRLSGKVDARLIKIFLLILNPNFILCSQKVYHCTLSWASWNHSTTFHLVYPRYGLILSSQLCVGPASDLLPSDIAAKMLICMSRLSHIATCLSHPYWFNRPNNIWQGNRLWISSLCNYFWAAISSSLLGWNFLIRTVPKHPQFVFFI
jgi:hypothetical protein